MKITVLGCGWLGTPLCEKLVTKEHQVTGTTTTSEKKNLLASKFPIVTFNVAHDKADPAISDCEVLIYTIPPLHSNEVETFFKTVDPEKKIIFISSTSVYGKNQGPCTEATVLHPEGKTGIALIKSEVFLRSRFKNLIILRPGGLIGADRHPAKHLAGKILSSGQEFLHLVSREDCIKAIIKILEINCWGQTINLINDLRITKAEYYTNKARESGLELPQFILNQLPALNEETRTKISNKLSKNLLSLEYDNDI